MKDHRDRYEQHPELRRFNAVERFKEMVADVEGIDTVDLSRAMELKARIQEYDPEVHGPPPGEHETREGPSPELEETTMDEVESDPLAPPRDPTVKELRGDPLPASEPVEAGQVLAFDPEHPGAVRAAPTMADPWVIGVAIGMEDDALRARVVATGFVECKVDAGYGAIRAGDLLTSSPTEGHAMRVIDVLPGTILGKALEPLDAGSGTITILVMPR